MKTCFKCNLEKPLDDFYNHPQTADGKLNKCKDCSKRDSRDRRIANIEYYRAYDRKRGSRQSAEYRREYRERNPKKYKAVTAVNNAVRDGKLVKPESCQECGIKTRIHGHHDDYDKKLEVIWLCPVCHKERHKMLGWGYTWNFGK